MATPRRSTAAIAFLAIVVSIGQAWPLGRNLIFEDLGRFTAVDITQCHDKCAPGVSAFYSAAERGLLAELEIILTIGSWKLMDQVEFIECMTGCLGIKDRIFGLHVISDEHYTYNSGYEAALPLLNQLGSEVDGEIADWSDAECENFLYANEYDPYDEYPHLVRSGEHISSMLIASSNYNNDFK